MKLERDELVVRCVESLAAIFGVSIDAAMLHGYRIGLSDLTCDEITRAVERAIKTKKFMPRPAELIELVRDRGENSRAELAWPMAIGVVRRLGAYRSVTFHDDPLTNATIQSLGGWVVFCNRYNTEPDSDKWLRKDFLETYHRLLATGAPAELCRPLVGEFDQHNLLHFPGAVREPRRCTTNLPKLIGMNEQYQAALPSPASSSNTERPRLAITQFHPAEESD